MPSPPPNLSSLAAQPQAPAARGALGLASGSERLSSKSVEVVVVLATATATTARAAAAAAA